MHLSHPTFLDAATVSPFAASHLSSMSPLRNVSQS